MNLARRLCGAVQELVRGEALDVEYESRRDLTTEDYLLLAQLKTGSLMGAACALGAAAVGACPEVVTRMDRFGRSLGLAFQIADDLLGIFGDPAITGKPVGADLRRRKWTHPVLIALPSPDPAVGPLKALCRSTTPVRRGRGNRGNVIRYEPQPWQRAQLDRHPPPVSRPARRVLQPHPVIRAQRAEPDQLVPAHLLRPRPQPPDLRIGEEPPGHPDTAPSQTIADGHIQTNCIHLTTSGSAAQHDVPDRQPTLKPPRRVSVGGHPGRRPGRRRHVVSRMTPH